jgi:hypothetical protein
MRKLKDTTYLCGGPPPSLLVAYGPEFAWWRLRRGYIIYILYKYIYLLFHFIHVYTQQFWNIDQTNQV